MKELSRVASAISPSATLAVNALAKKLAAEGKDIVNFSAGEPDFNTPEHIKHAGIKAIIENKTFYSDTMGIMPLRHAICEHLKLEHDLDYEPSQICVSSGVKHVLYIVLMALINPGDEVIVPAPYWVTYYEAVKIAGGIPVVIEATEENRFKITPEQLQNAITDKTKCLLLCNPSNPTGMLYTKEELEKLAEVIVKNDIYVIDDEIYSSLTYIGEFFSIAELGEEICERAIVLKGVSKAYAMTGWRIGYAACNKQLAKVISSYLSHSTGNVCNIAQYAALEAYIGDQHYTKKMKKAFNARRQHFYERVCEMDNVSCLEPEGAFYIFMNIKKLIGTELCGETINNSTDFCQALLNHGGVAGVPGIAFGMEGYVRFSYATSMEEIDKGLDRIEKFLKGIPSMK